VVLLTIPTISAVPGKDKVRKRAYNLDNAPYPVDVMRRAANIVLRRLAALTAAAAAIKGMVGFDVVATSTAEGRSAMWPGADVDDAPAAMGRW
jgi:hypothetical protein